MKPQPARLGRVSSTVAATCRDLAQLAGLARRACDRGGAGCGFSAQRSWGASWLEAALLRRAIRRDFGGERAQNLKLVFILSLLGAQVLLGRSMPGGLGWRHGDRVVVVIDMESGQRFIIRCEAAIPLPALVHVLS